MKGLGTRCRTIAHDTTLPFRRFLRHPRAPAAVISIVVFAVRLVITVSLCTTLNWRIKVRPKIHLYATGMPNSGVTVGKRVTLTPSRGNTLSQSRLLRTFSWERVKTSKRQDGRGRRKKTTPSRICPTVSYHQVRRNKLWTLDQHSCCV